MNINTYILIFIFATLTINLIAQDPFHINYGLKDGLPSEETYDIETDQWGRIWIATDRGISIYNGYKFNNINTGGGLPNNTVFELIKDKKDNIWISAYDGSLSYFNGKEIIVPPIQEKLRSFQTGSWIQDIIQANDSIYYLYFKKNYNKIQTEELPNQPLLKLNINNWKLTPIELSLNYFKNNLFELGQNNVVYDKKNKILLPTNKFADKNYYIIPQIANFTTQNHRLNNAREASSLIIDNSNNQQKVFESIEIFTKLNTINNQLWLSTEKNGVIILNYNKGQLNVHKKIFEKYYVSNLLQDNNGNIWLSTLTKGIIYIPNYKINKIQIDDLSASSFFENINTELILFDKHTQKNYVINKSEEVIKTIDRKGSAAAFVKNDTMFLPAKQRLIKNESEVILKIKPFGNNLKSEYWSSGLHTVNGHQVLANYGFKVFQNGALKINSNSFFDEKILHLYQDKSEKIWIATLNGLYSISDYNFEEVNKEKSINNFFDTRITDILNDNSNGMWFSSLENGIAYYHKGKIVYHLSKELSSPIVHKIELQNDSTLWVATNQGLNKINFEYRNELDFKIKSIQSYHTTEGLLSNFINDIHFWNKKMWLSTKEGIMSIDPDDLSYSDCKPSITIDSILTDGFKFNLDIEERLAYNQNDIKIHYTGVSLKKPMKDEFYYYQLNKDNSSVEWKKTNSRALQFMNLKHGNYTFKIKAKNKYGKWSTSEGIYNFKITPHYTSTLWFKFLLTLFLCIIIFAILKFRIKQLLKREAEKRKFQETEYRAQKAELNALRGQMNPHFIYNAINSIQNYIFKNDHEGANYYLSKISRLIRNSLEMSKLEFVTLDHEINFLKTYLELERMRFKEKFQFKFNIDHNIPRDIKIPPLILQPLIENSVKHAFKAINHKGQIDLFIEKFDTSQIKIIIKDNGVGIDHSLEHKKGQNHKSLSINIITERINIINAANKREVSKIEIKDRFKLEGVSGTVAILILPLSKKYK